MERAMIVRQRAGFTLFELLTVIVLMGLVLAIAYPRINNIATNSSLRGARGAMITAVNVTKSSAISSGKCAFLKLSSSSVTVYTTPCQGGTQKEIVSNRNFGTDYGFGVQGWFEEAGRNNWPVQVDLIGARTGTATWRYILCKQWHPIMMQWRCH